MADPTSKHFLAEIEEKILDIWQVEHTFEKSLAQREGSPVFSFYDGPPFANGVPHYGHLEQTTIKDTVTRYKTMRGYYVPRRVGWDTHGLPVEYAIEKQHDFKSKKDIISYGIAKFNEECRASVYEFKDVWEKMFRRVGRWADYEKTYSTLDDDYMESVWWVFKTIYDKDLIYKDFRSSPYCPRCATPLSNFELNQGYQDNIKDPSLFVKFKLTDENAYLLAWTTTPWSLPGNSAVAVKPDADYVYVNLVDDDSKQEETLILAKDRLDLLAEKTYKVVKEIKGADLEGMSYEPLFKLANLSELEGHEGLYKVHLAEFVSISDGSGVLHVAPAFGEDDLLLGKQLNLPILITVDENGHIKTDLGLPDFIAGKFFKQADNPIIEYLTKSNNVYGAEHILHTYPFCWRCDTPLLYYATDSWLVKVTDVKQQIITNNQYINWTPNSIRDGRFGKWLDQARDWAISRNRFWGAPIPVWVTEDGEICVIGSIKELKERAVDPSKVSDLHRPYIDDVIVKTNSGKLAYRIPEVFDCWFESGSMPYAQDHYPFEDQDNWEKRFPANFIAEAVDQTRGWFYTLHVLATALFDKPAFENAISSGWIVAADGQKLSKRKKNYAPMDDVFDQYGVDTLRYFISSSPLMNGEDTRFSVDSLREVQRKIFMTLHSTYTFYKLYADIDGWKPTRELTEPKSTNELDQWMVARINQTIHEVTAQMDNYRLDKAARPLAELIDDLSNWYVRRSRRRFWKSQDDQDKRQAYETLYYTLIRTIQLLAPFAPFLTDDIWRSLIEGTNLPKSVHLSDWPIDGLVDIELIEKMDFIRESIKQGLALRAQAGIKVRQPLSSITIHKPKYITGNKDALTNDLVMDELNVKEVKYSDNILEDNKSQFNVELDTNITDDLRKEGLIKEMMRLVQNFRKQSKLEIDDRIDLALFTDNQDLINAIENYSTTIQQETLATSLDSKPDDKTFKYEAKVGQVSLVIGISKSK